MWVLQNMHLIIFEPLELYAYIAEEKKTRMKIKEKKK